MTNYEKALESLRRELKENEKFIQLLKDITQSLKNENHRVNEIRSFLILPVQRLPRYIMLLQDLLKNTPNEKCNKKLNEAMNGIQTVTNYLNEKQKEHEETTKMLTYNEILGVKDLIQPHRRVVKTLENYSITYESEKYSFYLFTDILVILKKSTLLSKSKGRIIPLSSIVSLKVERSNFMFLLTQNRLFEFQFESKNDCSNWLTAFQDTKEKLKEINELEKLEPLKKPKLNPNDEDENVKLLNVKIIKGVDFELCSSLGFQELYCSINVGKQKQKTESITVINSMNPVWNQQLDFNIDNELFSEVCIELYTPKKVDLIGTIKIPTNEIKFEKKYSMNLITKKDIKGIFVLEFIFYYDRVEEKKVVRSKMGLFGRYKGNNSELYAGFLKKVALFSSMNDNEVMIIASAVRENRYNIGDDIIRQGDKGDDFHIIIEGQCKVWKIQDGKRLDLVTLKKEAYFGELALLFDQPRAATVTSETIVKTISLDSDSFKLLLGPIDEILKRNTENYENYMKKMIVSKQQSQEQIPVLRTPTATPKDESMTDSMRTPILSPNLSGSLSNDEEDSIFKIGLSDDEFKLTDSPILSARTENKSNENILNLRRDSTPVKLNIQKLDKTKVRRSSQIENPNSPQVLVRRNSSDSFIETVDSMKKLNIIVIKGVDFPITNKSKGADLFCQVIVGKQKQKTEIKYDTLNPVWNQQLNFNIEGSQFHEVTFEVYSWSLTRNELIGTYTVPNNEIDFEKKYSTKLNLKTSHKEQCILDFIFYYDKKEVKKSTPKNTIQTMFTSSKDIKEKRELFEGFLKKVPLFSSMTDMEISVIASAVNENKYKIGDDIIKQGDKGDDFHIIIEGQCKVWKNQDGKRLDLVTLKKEAYFGELALIFDQPRAATVTADSTVKTISLDSMSFKLLLGPIDEILKRNTENYENVMKKVNASKQTQEPKKEETQILSPKEETNIFQIVESPTPQDPKQIEIPKIDTPKRRSTEDVVSVLSPKQIIENLEKDGLKSPKTSIIKKSEPVLLDLKSNDSQKDIQTPRDSIKTPRESGLLRRFSQLIGGSGSPITRRDSQSDSQISRRNSSFTNDEKEIKILNATIIKGLDFFSMGKGKNADLFCQISIGKQRQKTEIAYDTLNPVWNQQLNFNLEGQIFNEIIIEVFHSTLTKNEFIGSIKIPMTEIQFETKYSKKLITRSFKQEQCILDFIFYLDKKDLKRVQSKSSFTFFKNTKELKEKRELFESFIKKVQLFSSMNDLERSTISNAVRENKYKIGEDIIKQGDKGDDFHIIIEGQCKVWKIQDGKRLDLVTLKKEAYFGELALLYDQPRAATVTSDSIVKTISLDSDSFKLLLGPIDEILKRNTENYENYMKKINLPVPKVEPKLIKVQEHIKLKEDFQDLEVEEIDSPK